MSFITNYSTGLAPFPRLSAPPHSSHTPIAPRRPGGTPETALYSPPLPPLPGGARQGGRGVPGGKDRRGERKGDGRMRSDREERGEREKKKKSRSGSRTHCRSVLNQLSGSLAVPCDGTGPLWWTARCSSASWRTAMAPPVEGSRQRVSRSLLLHQPGGWQQAPAHWRTAPTPPLPLGWQPPLLVPGARQRAFRPTCSSIAPAPPLRAATGGLRFFLLPDLLSTAIPLSSEGSLTACPSFLPGFGHQCNEVRKYGKKEAGTGEHLTHFNNKINKHK